MSDRILFLSNGSICYDSTTYFIDCISEELKAMGWEVMHIRLDKATQRDKLCVLADEYDSQPFDYIFDVNTNVICLDEMHKKFVDETYPHINSCIVLPLAAKQAESGLKPYDMRDNDLIFTASYTDPDMVYFKAKKQDSENVYFFNTFTQILFDNPELTQEEAIRKIYPGISGTQTAEKLQQNFMADVYIQAAIRQEFVVQLIRNHVPVKLYGHNWDTFLTKAEVLMKDDLPFIKEFVKDCGEVMYGELPKIYNNARLSINQLPWFKAGIHDRTPLALMNGCVSITDGSTYMRREIPMDSGVEYYSLDELEKVGEKIKSLVADVWSMKEKVARGVQYAEEAWRLSLLVR